MKIIQTLSFKKYIIFSLAETNWLNISYLKEIKTYQEFVL